MKIAEFPKISQSELVSKLDPPKGKVRMVLDTDTYNEIDDQFAVVYSMLSKKLEVEAIYAAPFYNERVASPSDGMLKSYAEILNVLKKINVATDNFVYKGSTEYFAQRTEPEKSAAVADLIKRALAPSDRPLYVVAIGAITNIASAIMIEPKIIERIVVVWLGGNALHWPAAGEFNLRQDISAAKIVFDCGVPLIHVPCRGVTTHLRTTVPEMEKYVKPHGEIGEYLFQIFANYHENKNACGWSKEIWDIAPVAFLINADWLPSHLIHAPVLTGEATWSVDNSRHFIRYIYMINRDPIFRDLFSKLELQN